MSDTIPTAIATEKRRFSVVWLIPLLALMLGGWLTFKYLQEKGTVVQIEFNSAEGLVAGKTSIKYKNVEIGLVDDIQFGSNLANVLVTATINREMRQYLTEKTRFWVVRARVAAGEVTGLGTLLAGAYIGMDPGNTGSLIKTFRGLNQPPLLFTEDHGSQFQLRSKVLYSFSAGAPIYYRRLKVGEVLSYELNEQGNEFEIQIFVKDPYNKFVNESSLFWNASGVDLKLGANGLEMQAESMVSILLGGIAFDNMGQKTSEPATSGSVFELHKNRDLAASTEYKRSDQRFRLYFDGSARGLQTGAPVTLRGINIGYVTDVRLEYDMQDQAFKIPVTVEFEPHRFTITGDEAGDREPPSTADLVDRGLRAQLRSGNILTGQMLIDLDIYPDADPAELEYEGEYLILPTIPTTIDSLMHSLNGFLENISQMPLPEIGANLNSSLQNLNSVLQGVDTLVQSSDITDTLANIKTASAELNSTLTEVKGVAAGLSENSDAYQAVLRTMHELSGASRALRQMAEYLERHPEALLKGKSR